MSAYQINIPYQTPRELAMIELLIDSGRIQERQIIEEAIQGLCSCEPRKLYACTCEGYVKDLLKVFKKGKE